MLFSSQVIESFFFLESDHNFSIVSQDNYHVRYETGELIARVFHGKRSYEIGFEVGLKSDKEEYLYRLPIILKALDANLNKFEKGFYQAQTANGVKLSLQKLAPLVQSNCSELLRGDVVAFSAVDAAEKAESAKVTDYYSLSSTRKKAEVAWDKKDYRKVIRIYETFHDKLSELEIKRLGYAKRKQKGSESV